MECESIAKAVDELAEGANEVAVSSQHSASATSEIANIMRQLNTSAESSKVNSEEVNQVLSKACNSLWGINNYG